MSKWISLSLAILSLTLIIVSCSSDSANVDTGTKSPAENDSARAGEEPPHLDEGGEFTDIHDFADYLDTVGMQCEIEYEQGDGGRCLFNGRPADVHFDDSIPILTGQTLRDYKKFGIDSFAIGWNWRVDTGYDAIIEEMKRSIRGVRTLFI